MNVWTYHSTIVIESQGISGDLKKSRITNGLILCCVKILSYMFIYFIPSDLFFFVS